MLNHRRMQKRSFLRNHFRTIENSHKLSRLFSRKFNALQTRRFLVPAIVISVENNETHFFKF